MDKILFLLFKNNAHKKACKISTNDISRVLSMSQQNASRKLILLEKEGLILRNSDGIFITKKGIEIGKQEYLELKCIFEDCKIKIEGKIISGTGEGGYYLSLPHYKKEIKKSFGFIPYPGTINVEIKEDDVVLRDLIFENLTEISGFKTKERTFGSIAGCFAKINGKKVVLIFPKRTHHPKTIIEAISDKKLTSLKIGKKAIIEVG